MAILNFGNEQEFLSVDGVHFTSIGALSESKIVVAYQDDNDNKHGKVKVGIVDGSVVTFGDEAEYFGENNFVNSLYLTVLSESAFIIMYQDEDNFGRGTVKLGTVDGTVVTFGDAVVFTTNRGAYLHISALDASGFVVGYSDWNNSRYGTARVGTITDGVIMFGSPEVFDSGGETFPIAVAGIDPSTSGFVVAYRKAGSAHGAAKIGTISGTTITFGNEEEFTDLASSISYSINVGILDPTTSGFVVIYRDENDSNHGTAKIGVVSDTDITFGDEAEFLSVNGTLGNDVSVLDSSTFAVVYKDSSDSNHGTAKIGTVVGTTITFGDESEFLSVDGPDRFFSTALNSNKIAVVYKDLSDSDHGTVKVGMIASPIEASGDLSIYGHDILQSSGDMSVYGYETTQVSGDLLVYGHTTTSGLTSLFIYSPPPNIYDVIDLFVSGYIPDIPTPSGTEMRIIHHLTKTGDHDPQLISTFDPSFPPFSVNIEIWDIIDGQNTAVIISNSGCYAIGDTGRWGWSTADLPFTGERKKYHYYYKMVSNENEKQYGEFFITVPEHGIWSYPD